MNKRGVVLIISYMVIAVLVILGISLIARSVSESNIAQRHFNSSKAFWLAEAGIAAAIEDFPNSPLNGFLDDANHTYTTQTQPVAGVPDRYSIVSTGSVTRPSADTITRTVQVIVEVPQPGSMDDAISATGNIVVGGAAKINGTVNPNAVFTFEEKFGLTEAQMRAQADYYYKDPPNNVLPVDGITWIDTTPGNEVVISLVPWSGNGILIVNGDVKMTGGDFTGIMWVNGTFEVAAGNPEIYGTVFANCGAEDTVVLGTADLTWDINAINDALSKISPFILSWQEL
ncbi:MAG: hypothetical protein PVI33_03385 [Candidatus Omnitrophota bacterium]|jgi:Tfp pilus assembly protein PilX